MAQKSAQLPYFEMVQHLNRKSRAKNFFAKVIRPEAEIYLCENEFGDEWHIHVVKPMVCKSFHLGFAFRFPP